jgi:precorrin-4/cobalt-precorrin-4 C11-methyltransferase
MNPSIHPVIFAGAGPGDPELVTVKTMKALKQADLILYAGSLVPRAVLVWKSSHTQTLSSAGMDLGKIVETMKSWHRQGKRVVRLHTGDPSLYGAICEQILELKKENIPCQVIPGVTAAFAAAAAMGMEYTLPEITQTLILTRIAGRTPVPASEDLEKLAAHGSSMAIYLSMGYAGKVARILETHYGAESLCAVAYKVSHPEEQVLFTPIKDLTRVCQENNISRHALIIVGKAVEAARQDQDMIKSKLYDAAFSHGYRPTSIQ